MLAPLDPFQDLSLLYVQLEQVIWTRMVAARYADARFASVEQTPDPSRVQFAPHFKPYLPCLPSFSSLIYIHPSFMELPSSGKLVQIGKACTIECNYYAD